MLASEVLVPSLLGLPTYTRHCPERHSSAHNNTQTLSPAAAAAAACNGKQAVGQADASTHGMEPSGCEHAVDAEQLAGQSVASAGVVLPGASQYVPYRPEAVSYGLLEVRCPRYRLKDLSPETQSTKAVRDVDSTAQHDADDHHVSQSRQNDEEGGIDYRIELYPYLVLTDLRMGLLPATNSNHVDLISSHVEDLQLTCDSDCQPSVARNFILNDQGWVQLRVLQDMTMQRKDSICQNGDQGFNGTFTGQNPKASQVTSVASGHNCSQAQMGPLHVAQNEAVNGQGCKYGNSLTPHHATALGHMLASLHIQGQQVLGKLQQGISASMYSDRADSSISSNDQNSQNLNWFELIISGHTWWHDRCGNAWTSKHGWIARDGKKFDPRGQQQEHTHDRGNADTPFGTVHANGRDDPDTCRPGNASIANGHAAGKSSYKVGDDGSYAEPDQAPTVPAPWLPFVSYLRHRRKEVLEELQYNEALPPHVVQEVRGMRP